VKEVFHVVAVVVVVVEGVPLNNHLAEEDLK